MAQSNTGPLSAGPQGSFPQTGSWSMVDIAKLPVQATIGILSRYAAGRVNPYTVLVSETLCNEFRLTAKGRANIETAVASLTAVSAVGATLEFGFGVEDLVRSMTKSEQGTIVLALCGAMMEVYSLDISAEIWLQVAELTGVGGQWMPSSREWKAILNACSGVLAPTNFGVRAEVLMQLQHDEQRLGAFQRSEATPQNLRECSSPKSIAEALVAISAVTRKELQAITLIGGPDAGWLCAVAEWIMDLKVSISNHQGEILYTNVTGPEQVQVQIIFGREATSISHDIIIQGKTYILKGISEVLGGEFDSTVVSGRLEWKTALRSAFLLDFKRLKESLPETLGTLLGSAARIYKGVAQADKTFPLTYRTACTTYCDQSFGPGFVINAISWFPELATLREHMEEAVAAPLKEARRDYEGSIARLRQYCSCRACLSPLNGFDLNTSSETQDPDLDHGSQAQASEMDEMQESASNSESEDYDDWDCDKYCAVIIAETIVVLSRALASVSLDDSRIKPMRSGFELAYGRQLNMRRSAQSGRQALKDLGQFAFCMDFDANFSFGMREHDYGTGTRLDLVLELFSGVRPQLSNSGVSAACSQGLCAYFRILRDVSLTKGDVGSIGIIPGPIQFEKRSYTTLEDRYVGPDESFDSTMADLVNTDVDTLALELTVKESSTALKCLFQLPQSLGLRRNVVAGPANLADFIAARRGLVHCNQRGRSWKQKPCPQIKGLTSGERRYMITEGGRLTKDWMGTGKGVWVFYCRNPSVASVVLSHCAAQYNRRASMFVVDRECLDCCLKTANDREMDGDTYFFYLAES